MQSMVNRIAAITAACTLLLVPSFGVSSAFADESGSSAQQQSVSSAANGSTIVNDTFWKDTSGKPIYSQGGGIFDFTDPATGKTKHYWYGVHYEQAESYAANPTAPAKSNSFKSVDVYSSDDLIHWTNEGVALSYNEANKFAPSFGNRNVGWVGRTGVAYVKELKVYALFIQNEMPTDDNGNYDKEVMIATSKTPAGPFTADRRINMNNYGLGTSNTGDQSVFQDEDGTGYLIYSYGRGRVSQWVAKIGAKDGHVDLLNPTKVYQGRGREGNCMFKYKGRYYYASSDLFGWNASRVHYMVADNIFGPYTPTNDTIIMDGSQNDFSHTTQTGFYYTVHGSQQETVIHAGDRWSDFAGNGLGYNQWEPLSFDASGVPFFNSMSQWNLDAQTGKWSVAQDNNYVLNGDFESDRATVPAGGYKDKDGKIIPDIAGWTRTNGAAVSNKPDKDGRVGNFNLEFWSAKSYSAKIEQTIKPKNFALPDGSYILTAQYKNFAAVKDAKLYAISGGKTYSTSLSSSTDGKWVSATVPVTVSDGSVVVGLSVEGNAQEDLKADDITLVRSVPQVSTENLQSVITKAEQLEKDDYTSESWARLQSAVENGRTILKKSDLTQDAVDAAEQAVESAISGLVKASSPSDDKPDAKPSGKNDDKHHSADSAKRSSASHKQKNSASLADTGIACLEVVAVAVATIAAGAAIISRVRHNQTNR